MFNQIATLKGNNKINSIKNMLITNLHLKIERVPLLFIKRKLMIIDRNMRI